MNSIVNFYKRLGRGTTKAMDYLSFQPIFKGVNVPLKQTPGRAQYYYPESLHLIPDNIVYKVRMPLKIAGMEDSKKYEDIVQTKVLEYLKSNFEYNLYDPEKGLHLDMTIGELRHLTRASDHCFATAGSGKLQKIVDKERSLKKQTEALILKMENTLEDVEQKIDLYESKTYALMAKHGISSSAGATDYIPGFGRDGFDILIADVNNALRNDSKSQTVKDLAGRVYAIADARHKVSHIRLDLVNCWNEHHENHTYDEYNYEDASKAHDHTLSVFRSVVPEWKGTKTTFVDALDNMMEKDLPEYLSATTEYEKAYGEKESFFSQFVHDDVYDHKPEKLKEDLLAYLSSAIVVKEHRYRYQAEQYDRYLTLMKWMPVYDFMTLREFALSYAENLRREVEISYNFTSPKIEANFDDFGERKVNPINATVFYYFFNANRTRRKLAQVILSAARYPNEKIRRAYLRFFSNA